MGQTPSAIVNRNHPHAWVQEPRPYYFFDGPRKFQPDKPSEMTPVPDALWHEFSASVDVGASKINAFRTLLLLPFTLAVGILLYGFFADSFIVGLVNLDYVLFPAILVWIAGTMLCEWRNQHVDLEIEEIRVGWEERFREKGYTLEYRTEHVNVIKYWKSKPARLIAFPLLLNPTADTLETLPLAFAVESPPSTEIAKF